MSKTRKITKLTPKQKAQIPAHIDKWIKIGLRTGETDWETFDKYMPICYKKAELEYPKNIVRVSSPLVGALAASIADRISNGKTVRRAVDGAVGDTVDREVRDTIGRAVGDTVDGIVKRAVDGEVRDTIDGEVRDTIDRAVGGAVDGTVRRAVDGEVGDTIGRTVDREVRDAVDGIVRAAVDREVEDTIGRTVDRATRDAIDRAARDAVGRTVDREVRDTIDGAVGDAVGAHKLSWYYWIGGQFWVGGWYWYGSPAYVSFFTDVCKLKLPKDIEERAEAYSKICQSVNYVWADKNFVMVCARPKHIYRDEQGRLHSPDSKAIEYHDGWGLYMWHGIKVSKKIIETPETLTKKDIVKETNVEVRRCIIEKIGMERYAELLGVKEVDRDTVSTEEAVLYKTKRKDNILNNYAYFVKVSCPSSKRKYMLGVPYKLFNEYPKNCWDAKAMTFRKRESQYNIIKET